MREIWQPLAARRYGLASVLPATVPRLGSPSQISEQMLAIPGSRPIGNGDIMLFRYQVGNEATTLRAYGGTPRLEILGLQPAARDRLLGALSINRSPAAWDLAALDAARAIRDERVADGVVGGCTALEAIRGLRKQHDISADDIGSVEIRLGKGSYQNVGWAYTATTITSAQLNLYYVSSLMLLENDVFVDQFTELTTLLEMQHPPTVDMGGE